MAVSRFPFTYGALDFITEEVMRLVKREVGTALDAGAPEASRRASALLLERVMQMMTIGDGSDIARRTAVLSVLDAGARRTRRLLALPDAAERARWVYDGEARWAARRISQIVPEHADGSWYLDGTKPVHTSARRLCRQYLVAATTRGTKRAKKPISQGDAASAIIKFLRLPLAEAHSLRPSRRRKPKD